MNNKSDSSIRNESVEKLKDCGIPRIVISSPVDLGDNLIAASGIRTKEEEINPRNKNSNTTAIVSNDKTELKKAKLKQTNITRKETNKSATSSWQKTFTRRQTERLINKDKVLSRVLESKYKKADDLLKKPSMEKASKTNNAQGYPKLMQKTLPVKTKSRVVNTVQQLETKSLTRAITHVMSKEHKENEDRKTTFINEKSRKSKDPKPENLKRSQKVGSDNGSNFRNTNTIKSNSTKGEISYDSNVTSHTVLKNPLGVKEDKNIKNKDFLNVPKLVKNGKEDITTSSQCDDDRDNTVDGLEKSKSFFNSFKRRQKYSDDLRRRIQKKWKIDDCNRRLLYSQVYGRRKESVNKVQKIIKEENAKRQVSFSNTDMPTHTSKYKDIDNSFYRYHDISTPSSMASAKSKGRLSAVVKPMPSKKENALHSFGFETNRPRVLRSPTFTKEAPEVLQYDLHRLPVQHFPQNLKQGGIHQTRDEDIRKTESKLKYKPHIHRRFSGNESVHLYTEVYAPPNKNDYQKNFDSFVLLDKNFDDSDDPREGRSPDQIITKYQRRLTSSNKLEIKSTSGNLTRNLSERNENNSKHLNSPVLEIVFQPNMGDIYMAESEEQNKGNITRVYMTSGKVSAFLHRSTSAPSHEYPAENIVAEDGQIQRSKVTSKTRFSYISNTLDRLRKTDI